MMAAPSITIERLEPTKGVSRCNRLLHWHEQTEPAIPPVFINAMEVREQVFVIEQGVPLEYECDEDDHRCCHWVVYASSEHVVESAVRMPGIDEVVRTKRSEKRTTPVGTIRMVPFPHPPAPRNGGEYVDGKLVNESVLEREVTEESGEEAVKHGHEPYLKLGRLAVVQDYRGRNLGGLLVRTALGWIATNPRYFDQKLSRTELGSLGSETGDEAAQWHGLVCIHAQKERVKMWEKLGFKVDATMGEWKEEGMDHVAMFRRLDVSR